MIQLLAVVLAKLFSTTGRFCRETGRDSLSGEPHMDRSFAAAARDCQEQLDRTWRWPKIAAHCRARLPSVCCLTG